MSADVETLPAGIEPFTRGELAGLRVNTDRCSGEIAHQGAQVLHWAPTGSHPVLFVAELSTWVHGKSVRGGVPLCSPWFGPGRNGDRTPEHGFVRVAPWELVDATVADSIATIRYRLTPQATAGLAGTESFPSSFRFEYTVVMGDELSLSLTTLATDQALDLEEAIHTHFSVADVHTTQVLGLDGRDYRDKVDGGTVKTQSGPVEFTGETDRVYDHCEGTSILDRGRTIHIEQSGAGNVVVWNAGAQRAAELGDMGEDDWPRYICLESANAFENSYSLQPGQSHTITQAVRVTRR